MEREPKREERLAEALRANLRRRKDQQRAAASSFGAVRTEATEAAAAAEVPEQ